ncbi:hypothetical protein GCM10020219_023560 [Nonomuraea dietziae]
MAIPKKGSRLITVDGARFRWRVRRKPTYCQGNSWGPMMFAMELADTLGRVLLVSLPCSRPDAWWGERTMAIRAGARDGDHTHGARSRLGSAASRQRLRACTH